MKKIVCLCLAVVMGAMLPGCSGKKKVSIKSYPGIGDETGRKLIVLLPTIGGKAEHYHEEGFIASRSRTPARCRAVTPARARNGR